MSTDVLTEIRDLLREIRDELQRPRLARERLDRETNEQILRHSAALAARQAEDAAERAKRPTQLMGPGWGIPTVRERERTEEDDASGGALRNGGGSGQPT